MDERDRELEQRCEAEIVELHQFFGDWFSASEESSIDFDRFAEVLAPDFTMVGPDGRLVEASGPRLTDCTLFGSFPEPDRHTAASAKPFEFLPHRDFRSNGHYCPHI